MKTLGISRKKKDDGVAQVGARGDPQDIIGDPEGEGHQPAVNRIPDNERQSQEDQLEDLPGRQISDCRFHLRNGIHWWFSRFGGNFRRHRLFWWILVIHG